MGGHCVSEFRPWSWGWIANTPVLSICKEGGNKNCKCDLDGIEVEVRAAAEKIIEAKRATYYGIGMAMVRITRAIFGNENSVLTVSSMMRGEYGESNVYVGAPCIVNRNGVQKVLELDLSDEEKTKFHSSCDILRDLYGQLNLP